MPSLRPGNYVVNRGHLHRAFGRFDRKAAESLRNGLPGKECADLSDGALLLSDLCDAFWKMARNTGYLALAGIDAGKAAHPSRAVGVKRIQPNAEPLVV